MGLFKAAEKNGLKPGSKTMVEVGGRVLTLARLDDGYYAIENRCPHRSGPLCDGTLDADKGEIVCPLHGWNFDLRTGVSPYNPSDTVTPFPVEEREDGIYIRVEEEQRQPHREDYLEPWRRRHDDIEGMMETLHHYADGWVGKHGLTEPMGPEKKDLLWDELVFLPRQVSGFPAADDAPVNLKTVIGKSADKPLTIDLPVYVSHMSFGALSREAKIALARGSKAAGTAIGSGEGGMLPEERDRAGAYIFEMATGYFGWNEENIKRADAVEIKMGQAAKAGMGGMLPGSKVTDEIAGVRGLKAGKDAVSPSRFPDIPDTAGLRARVDEIRAINGGKPVGMKIAANRLEKDLDAALECGVDFITLDGRGGATGAAPKHIKDNVGVPTLYALARAVRFLRKTGSTTDLMVTGGLRTPADAAKALALGATGIASATSALIAIGCQQYRACNSGNCPVGIATQKEELRQRFNVDTSAEKLENFFAVFKYQLEDFARICGKDDVHLLSPDDLAALDGEVARYTGLPHVGESPE